MAADTQVQAYSAFESQLKTLCLKEFPCGLGTWREGNKQPSKKSKKPDNVESRFSITLKDFGSQIEKTEVLEEYVGSAKSPWSLDYSWSKEAKPLRELAVKSPWLIDDNFVLSYFKTLRIINRNVTEIDPNLLKFKNLEELTLSCNLISQIDSRNLPSNLKVLEMCANEISDLSALCVKPPRLIHLGLGYNQISFIGDYLTASYWPCLLSLDLSNNNLSDLLDVVHKVGSMPKLRNLVLQGNPLALIPGYRGYTVDSMKKLSVLDDIMISADERHYFKGLARRREYILDEAKVKLAVSYIKGLPQPEELKNPEDQPEYPVIERKYYVQFMFPEDTTLKTEVLQMEEGLDMDRDMSLLPTDRTEGQEMDILPTGTEDQAAIEKNVYFTEEPDTLHTIETAATGNLQTEPAQSPEEVEEKKREEKQEERVIKLAAVKSASYPWGDDIECGWSQMVVRDDLLGLRDFFKQGMTFSVVEEMTLAYPVIPEEPEDAPKRRGSSKSRSSSKSESNPADSSKPSSASGKAGGGKDKKDKKERKTSAGKEKDGKKKKKVEEVELKRGPPTITTLATWHLGLADFLEGEFHTQAVFTQGTVEIASTVKSVDTDSARKILPSRASGRKSRDGPGSRRASQSSRSGFKDAVSKNKRDKGRGETKDKNKKPPSASKKKEDPKDKSKERKASAKGGKDAKGDKGKGGKAAPPAVEEEEDPGPPPPLEGRGETKDKNKKPPSASKKKEDPKDKSKERKASAKGGKDAKGDKGKGGKAAPPAVEEEEDPGPPPPLEVHIAVDLHHWKTAMDLLRDEEEKNKAEEKSESNVA